MLNELLKSKNLPKLKSREEMVDILLKEEYGYLPPKPEKSEFKNVKGKPLNIVRGFVFLS